MANNLITAETDAVEINFQEIIKKVSQHYLRIGISVLVCVTAAIICFCMQKPVYQATSRILVETEPPKILKVENTVLPDYTDPMDFFNSQIEILKSHAIADLVFKELGTYEPLDRRGRSSGNLKPMGDDERENALLKQVKIAPVRMTQIITVSAEDNEPKLAAQIADSWVRSYILFSSLDQLLERRSELVADLNKQLEYYKKKHPIIKGLQRRIADIDQVIENEKEHISNQGNSSSNIIDMGGSVTNIKILDRAQVPLKPVSPKKIFYLLVGLVFGLFAGLVPFFFESFNPTINNLIDIEQVLDLFCLATIPFHKNKFFNGTEPAHVSSKFLRSGVAACFRSLKTGILFSNPGDPKKTFVITSSSPVEGKTMVAVNLATVFAQAKERTLLVDMDLHRPSLHTIFKVDSSNGIADILTFDKENIQSCIRKTETPGLDLMTCGGIPENPTELLGSDRMEKLIDRLSLIYDRIIFDTPPVLAATDAVILSSKVDTTILVVRAGVTNCHAALRSKQLLQSARASILGVVLNMVKFDDYGSGFYGYYYENETQNNIHKIPSSLITVIK